MVNQVVDDWRSVLNKEEGEMSNLFTLADQYRQLRNEKELEVGLKEVNRQLRRVEQIWLTK